MRVQGGRSNTMDESYWSSYKLGPRLLDEDPKPIQANLKWHLHGIILEGN